LRPLHLNDESQPAPRSRRRALHRCAAGALAAAALALGAPAWAENHALILWIGDYGNPRSDLPGIDLDAAHAKKIAQAMGVPAGNISELSNAQLTRANIGSALGSLYQRIKDGDRVFLYYSGHGGQLPGQGTSAKCSEALVARDGLILDSALQDALTKLGSKASQVVMMNDSCFSGGAATRSLASEVEPGWRPKFLPVDAKSNTAVTTGYACGDPTNTARLTRSLAVMAKDARGPQVLYIAASNDTQVSFATARGSVATLAWSHCIGLASADADRSGRINGEELRECAQAVLDRRGTKQTITLQGNAKLPLSFVQVAAAGTAPAAAPAAPAAPAVAPAPTPVPVSAPAPAPPPAAAPAPVPLPAPLPAPPAPAPVLAAGRPPVAPAPAPAPPAPPAATVAVNAAQVLHDLQAAADRSLPVQLTLARDRLRIGKDLLDFSVATQQPGYLYVLQVGSDGKTFNLLFPNKIDGNNFLPAGTHRFPRETWRVRAGGPPGKSHLLAIVSPVKKDLSRDMDASSVFPSSSANQRATRTLVIEATGAGEGGSGRYGASEVVTLSESLE